MKYILLFVFGLTIVMLSFQKQDNVGKIIFERSCKSCHLPNKATQIAPPFQNIRKDYGLKWTLSFINNSRRLRENRDVNALYSYYLFEKIKHIDFPALESEAVVKILDYVDSFPYDSSGSRHRLVSYSERKRFVMKQLAIDTIVKNERSPYNDTLYKLKNDSLKIDSQVIRPGIRRGLPQKNEK